MRVSVLPTSPIGFAMPTLGGRDHAARVYLLWSDGAREKRSMSRAPNASPSRTRARAVPAKAAASSTKRARPAASATVPSALRRLRANTSRAVDMLALAALIVAQRAAFDDYGSTDYKWRPCTTNEDGMHGMVTDPSYRNEMGAAVCGDSRELLRELPDGSVNLVLTSPPFALQRKKEYGNKEQHEYIDWLCEFAAIVRDKLTEDGSFVVDLGGSYRKGTPARSLYNFRIPIRFCDDLGFHLAEDFYWFNPSKLPSPIEWVNKRKLRAKDSVNTVWWFSKTEWPKADVTKVLAPYSERMKKLLKDPDGFYKPQKRPSGHDISSGFGKDNGGAIPSNLLQIPNSESNGQYLSGCNAVGVKRHPARFPAGSNTAGWVADSEDRRWLSFEERRDYVAASSFRFLVDYTDEEMRKVYDEIDAGGSVEVPRAQPIDDDAPHQRPANRQAVKARDAPNGKPSIHAEKLLELLKESDAPLSSSDAQSATGLDATSVREAFGELVDRGVIEKTGRRRGTKYALVGNGSEQMSLLGA